MKIEDFEQLHIEQNIYFGGEQVKISHLELYEGKYKIGFRSYLMSYIFTDIMDGLFFDKPKVKVKRAQYLYKFKNRTRPKIGLCLCLDQKDFLDSMGTCRDSFDFVTRLFETEKEFDE